MDPSLDMNGNGVYTDVFQDALVVGTSRVATFMSEVANVGGTLYTLRPSADGTKLDFAKYSGPTGTLDMKSGFDTSAKLMELVLVSADRRYSYDLSTAPKDGFELPMGQYLIHKGTLGLGAARVTIIQGRADPILVMPNGKTKVTWGGPISAEPDAIVAEGKVGIDPARLSYFGRLGEQYVGFKPMGKSPEFTITDARERKEIAKAIFTGC